MADARRTDAIVVGSGPNGLAAAIELAQAGQKVLVFEAEPTAGGGVRSAGLTLPGFTHDICSAVHPLAALSPFFRTLPLKTLGLEWIEPPAMLAHPFDDGSAVVIRRSLDETADALGPDRENYKRLIGGVVSDWPRIEENVLGPLRWPAHPSALARFGVHAMQPATRLATGTFEEPRTRATFAGIAAHGMLPLENIPSAAFGLVLCAAAHLAGWVIPKGGAQRLSDALVAHLQSLGGEVITGTRITSLDQLPPSRAILCDLSPRPLLELVGGRFPGWYRRQLERYRLGMGVFKVDWALDGPIPWRARECGSAATVHLGGTLDEIARSERDAWNRRTPEVPFVLLAQPSLFDPGRAPAGRHTAWAYCHVPPGSEVDMLPRIEKQIERFAPGFTRLVLARAVRTPADLERHNANLVAGDIAGGATNLRQLFFRPTRQMYSTPLRGLYICSSSTPPGSGVHGMCGYFAARRALVEVLQR